jgi:hypothetical protein
VRCVRCRTIWFARDPSALSAAAREFRTDIQSLALSAPGGDFADPTPLPAVNNVAPEAPSPPAETMEGEHPPESVPAEVVRPPAEAMPSAAIEDIGHELAPVAASGWQDAAAVRAEAAAAEDIETFAARRGRRDAAPQRAHWRLPGLPTAIMALIAINTALIGWRADVVRFVPQTASLYAAIGLPVNLRGLAFRDVASATEAHEGMPMLVVEGTIVSAKERTVEVPRLRFAARNRNGQEIYAWTALPSRSVLAPGEILTFRASLASPPPEAHDVLVRFFHRRDRVAGIQ